MSSGPEKYFPVFIFHSRNGLTKNWLFQADAYWTPTFKWRYQWDSMGRWKSGHKKSLLIRNFIILFCICVADDVKQPNPTHPFVEWRQFFIISFEWLTRVCVTRSAVSSSFAFNARQIFEQISLIDYGKMRRIRMKNANEGNELLREQFQWLSRIHNLRTYLRQINNIQFCSRRKQRNEKYLWISTILFDRKLHCWRDRRTRTTKQTNKPRMNSGSYAARKIIQILYIKRL